MSLAQEMEYEIRRLSWFKKLYEGLESARVAIENLKLSYIFELTIPEALRQSSDMLQEQQEKVEEFNDEFFSTKR